MRESKPAVIETPLPDQGHNGSINIHMADTSGSRHRRPSLKTLAIGATAITLAVVVLPNLSGCSTGLFNDIKAIPPETVTHVDVMSVLDEIQPRDDVILVNAYGTNTTTIDVDLQERLNVPVITPLFNDVLSLATTTSVTVERKGDVQVVMPERAITIKPYNFAKDSATSTGSKATWGIEAVINTSELYDEDSGANYLYANGQPITPHDDALPISLFDALFNTNTPFQQESLGTAIADGSLQLGCSSELASVDAPDGQTVISSQIQTDLRAQMLTSASALKADNQVQAANSLTTLADSNIPVVFENGYGHQVPAADISLPRPYIPDSKTVSSDLSGENIVPGGAVSVSIPKSVDNCYPNATALAEQVNIIMSGSSATVQAIA